MDVEFHSSFSRRGITREISVLLIWLNENVEFCCCLAAEWLCHLAAFL